MHTVHNLQWRFVKEGMFSSEETFVISYQRHSNSIILILLREKVSIFKLKSNARMVADGC